jgi:hypothetical protein
MPLSMDLAERWSNCTNSNNPNNSPFSTRRSKSYSQNQSALFKTNTSSDNIADILAIVGNYRKFVEIRSTEIEHFGNSFAKRDAMDSIEWHSRAPIQVHD